MSTLKDRRNGAVAPLTRAKRELIVAKRAIALGKMTEFRRQSERLAKRVAEGLIDRADAVDGLFDAAEANHLIETHGADFIQRTFVEVFNTASLDFACKKSAT